MTIVVTGATGHLGRLVVEALLDRKVPADQIVAAGRDTAKIADLADRGVQVRNIELNDPDTLRAAFAGARRILLVSGSEPGARLEQHRNAIEAAQRSGAELLAYTSIANADRATMQLAADHQATEKLLAAAEIPTTVLRNSWYLETYTDQVPVFLQHEAVVGSAGDGRVSAATRADYAAAAATVLTSDGHASKLYELGGDQAFTLTELAEQIAAAADQPVKYQDLPVEQYTQVLVDAGVPESLAAVYADSDRGLARGELLVTSGDLSRLIGRPTTSMPDAVRAALS